MSGTVHVVGAGLAGLSCAVAAARAGARVVLYEAAGHAGGRCRSFVDPHLDRLLDNGSHLLIGANRAALAFARAIGGHETLIEADPVLPFLDLVTSQRHDLAAGRLPAGLMETVAALGLPWVPRRETVAVRLGPAPSYARLWRPLCVAALNTAAEDASARQFARVLRAALLGGADALRPILFGAGLSAAFAAPALATLAVHGARVFFRRRLMALDGRDLVFDDGRVEVAAEDRVVLALPPWALAEVMPGVRVPPTRAIVNVSFRLPHGLVMNPPVMGLLGGTAEWVFPRGDVISATVSAADRLMDRANEDIAALVWRDLYRMMGAEGPPPPWRVLKERRATIAHTPEVDSLRPGPLTKADGLYLAGDWLASPWPATIESAVSSGLTAARLALGRRNLTFTS